MAENPFAIPQHVFQWCINLGVLTTQHVVPGTNLQQVAHVPLLPTAAMACISGHLYYYIMYNSCQQQGLPFEAQLLGAAGQPYDEQVLKHNWNVLELALGKIKLVLDPTVSQGLRLGSVEAVLYVLSCTYNFVANGFIQVHEEDSVLQSNGGHGAKKGGGRKVKVIEADSNSSPRLKGSNKSPQSRNNNKSPQPRNHSQSPQSRNHSQSPQSRNRSQSPTRTVSFGVGGVGGVGATVSRSEEEIRAEALKDLNVEAARNRPKPTYTADAIDLKHVKNRGLHLMCLSLLDEIVTKVASGAASKALRAQEKVKQHRRQIMQERKDNGGRLVDNVPHVVGVSHIVGVSHVVGVLKKKHDHNALIFCRSIVKEIVQRSVRDTIIEELMEKDAKRDRDRQVMIGILQRNMERERELRAQQERDNFLPLRLRREREKKEEEERKKEVAMLADERYERRRQENANRAAAEKKVVDLKREEEALQKQQEKLKEAKKKAAREKYLWEGQLVTQRRKVEHAEKDGRDAIAQAEVKATDTLAAMIRYHTVMLQKEIKKFEEEAEAKVIGLEDGKASSKPTLTAISIASGQNSAYQGDDYAMQFLTEAEVKLMKEIEIVRKNPQAVNSTLEDWSNRMATPKCNWFYSREGVNSKNEKSALLAPAAEDGSVVVREPMLMSEDKLAIAESVGQIKKLRASKPGIGAPSIGLTLAARQHAIDMVHHGLLNTDYHVGTDGSSVSGRVAKYGTMVGSGGVLSMVFGIIRPYYIHFTQQDVLAMWAMDYGTVGHTNRKVLFTNGDMAKSIGLGHASAAFEDRVLEVYTYLTCRKFEDKPVDVMAAAHQAGIQAVAPGFLQGKRLVTPDMQNLKLLYASSNICIGRSSQAACLKRLVLEPKRSSPKKERPSSSSNDVRRTFSPVGPGPKKLAPLPEGRKPSGGGAHSAGPKSASDKQQHHARRESEFSHGTGTESILSEHPQFEMYASCLSIQSGAGGGNAKPRNLPPLRQSPNGNSPPPPDLLLGSTPLPGITIQEASALSLRKSTKEKSNNSLKDSSSTRGQQKGKQEPAPIDEEDIFFQSKSGSLKETTLDQQRREPDEELEEEVWSPRSSFDSRDSRRKLRDSRDSRRSSYDSRRSVDSRDSRRNSDSRRLNSSSSYRSPSPSVGSRDGASAQPTGVSTPPTTAEDIDLEREVAAGATITRYGRGYLGRQKAKQERERQNDDKRRQEEEEAAAQEFQRQMALEEEEEKFMTSQSLRRVETFVIPEGAPLTQEQLDGMLHLYNDVSTIKESLGRHHPRYYQRLYALVREANQVGPKTAKIESALKMLQNRATNVITQIMVEDRADAPEYRKMLDDARSKAPVSMCSKFSNVKHLPQIVRDFFKQHEEYVNSTTPEEEIALIRADFQASLEVCSEVVNLAAKSAMGRISSLLWQERILQFYKNQLPDKDTPQSMLDQYQGREDILLQALVEQHGPEPFMVDMMTEFLYEHQPEKVDQVRELLVNHAGHEDELMDTMRKKSQEE